MKKIYVNITTTGYNPNYCELTSIITADASEYPFDVCEMKVESLDQERAALTRLCSMVKGNTVVYNDHRAIDFISECCKQYSFDFAPANIIPLCQCINELHVDVDQLKVSIPMYEGELKHFFKDYKNYYYLPAEDQAYHKSVAEFVDKSAREQAKARTAYIKKTGTFIPVYGDMPVDPDYIFKEDYSSKQLYTLPQYVDLNDPQVIASYILCSHKPQDEEEAIS